MTEPISFDAYLGWVDITDPNNIPQDARVISANDLLRYEKFGLEASQHINAKLDKVTAAALYAPLSSFPDTVRHGGDPTAPRTTTGPITWIGWVQPRNMQTHDLWLEIAPPPFKLKTSVAWEGLYLADDLTHEAGAQVASWADSGKKGRDLVRNTEIGTGNPVMQRKSVSFNGKNAVAFANNPLWGAALPAPQASQPYTVAMVVRALTQPSQLFAAGTSGTVYRQSATAGNFSFNPGGAAIEITGTKSTDATFVMVEFNGADSTGRANNRSVLTSTTRGGTQKLSQIKLGGWEDSPGAQLEISFLGIAPGLLGKYEKDGLIDWVNTNYALGLTK